MTDMEKDIMLQKIDELIDTTEGIVIRLARLDPALSDELHNVAMAWRALTLEAAGTTDDGLDALARKTDG